LKPRRGPPRSRKSVNGVRGPRHGGFQRAGRFHLCSIVARTEVWSVDHRRGRGQPLANGGGDQARKPGTRTGHSRRARPGARGCPGRDVRPGVTAAGGGTHGRRRPPPSSPDDHEEHALPLRTGRGRLETGWRLCASPTCTSWNSPSEARSASGVDGGSPGGSLPLACVVVEVADVVQVVVVLEQVCAATGRPRAPRRSSWPSRCCARQAGPQNQPGGRRLSRTGWGMLVDTSPAARGRLGGTGGWGRSLGPGPKEKKKRSPRP